MRKSTAGAGGWKDVTTRRPIRTLPRLPLPNTDKWVATLVGLPLSVDLDDEKVGYIASKTMPFLLDAEAASGGRVPGRATL